MRKGSRTLIVAVLVVTTAAVLMLTGCKIAGVAGSDSSGSSTSTTPHGLVDVGATGQGTMVGIQGKFIPDSVEIHVGDTITFVNRDKVAHHVVIDTTDLGNLAPLQKVSWTADKVGAFTVKCAEDSSIVGKIAVLAPGSGN
jgi:plastocyanin